MPENLLGLLEMRRSVSPMLLAEPGPTAGERTRLLEVAARVPDHGALVPWRFIVVEGEARARLARRLADACLAAADATDEGAREQAQRTQQKLGVLFGQPPLVVIVVMRPNPDSHIPVWEQELSAGAACMNLITAATAFGFSANWLTGWTASQPAARTVLGLSEDEKVAGIIPIGTPRERPPERPRPDLAAIVTTWAA